MRKENLLKVFILLINLIVAIRLFDIGILKHEHYKNESNSILNNYVYGASAPRGRILDAKGRVLVDNKGIKVLSFKKNSKSDIKFLCESLAEILDLKSISLTDTDKKKYYYFLHKKDIDSILDKNILEKYKMKQISDRELEEYKFTFIKDEELKNINEKECYLYKQMISGYSFGEKIIKTDITEEELVKINALNSNDLKVTLKWIRNYNYDTVLNQIFGSIGAIEEDDVNDYLSKGYSLDDTVGVSFLEKFYEEYLTGEKAVYQVINGNLELVEPEKRGLDLVLGIDINTQLEIESILKKEIENAKKYPSSKYYNGSYVIVSDPNNGLLRAIAGYDVNNNYSSDVVGTFTKSFTVGSVVKGASQSVAFINGAIDKDKKILDSCVKLKNMPSKCSWTKLGLIDDIDAIAQSSNYYQFINAIKVSGQTYSYNMNFKPTMDDFSKYRNVFNSYGLGSLSGIDLYEEKYGIVGSRISGDLLLNYVIGQYDTYTPLMLSSYINTLANDGIRNKIRIVDYAIDGEGNRVELNDPQELNEVGISKDDLKRVQAGLRKVIASGTASSYVDKSINAAGKTGTSETFYNGIPTTSRNFIMYAPYDDPLYSLVIVSPNLAYSNSTNNYKYPINSRLSREISNILFEK